MQGTLTILKPDGSCELRELNRKPELDELQACVGGWIELVPLFDVFNGNECVAFCNEEGKLDHLDYNAMASTLWWLCGGPPDDCLVGNVVICQGDAEFMAAL